ncbi:MAG: hypothetical protein ACT4PM_14330 [Gemmatimonadales bacterium]
MLRFPNRFPALALALASACASEGENAGSADSVPPDSSILAGPAIESPPPPAVRAAPSAEVRGPSAASGGPSAESGAPSAEPPGAESRVPTAASRSRSDSARGLVRTALLPGRTARDSISLAAAIRQALGHPGWPVAEPSPLPDAILPAQRIVAFYGNPLSTRMGILGALPKDQMLARLSRIAAEWEAADPATPVRPALHLIAVVAQEKPGRDGRYRLRMDTTLVRRVYGWAQEHGALLFLDIQAGHSTIQQELPLLRPWLSRPDVHLGIDPEFYMHYQSAGYAPGRRIGTLSAGEVNHAIEELGRLVTQYQLPPKVLVIHRFTENMVRDAGRIRLDPRVQVVINMDGWGAPWLKFDSYAKCQVAEPVQFTGFKLFFHNDTKKGDPLLTPREVLALRPRPGYVQYQ